MDSSSYLIGNLNHNLRFGLEELNKKTVNLSEMLWNRFTVFRIFFYCCWILGLIILKLFDPESMKIAVFINSYRFFFFDQVEFCNRCFTGLEISADGFLFVTSVIIVM